MEACSQPFAHRTDPTDPPHSARQDWQVQMRRAICRLQTDTAACVNQLPIDLRRGPLQAAALVLALSLPEY